ncbi:MAG: M20/M25/M40 family metallo-hydrolase [Anaerolineae bacterium]|nr:M20/M25/M40 family metallo-hydrolase [Anaerolineae bacterium]MDW8172957.1 M20/M25/M40 family metallo-hydrolase [Anaerolineae bacterium]
MPFDLKAHLQTLSETHAISGHEAPIRQVIREAWTGLVQNFDQDGLGSLIGWKRATRPPQSQPTPSIMLAAHMDEIGLMVRDIVDGFVYVARVAGFDPRTTLAKPVLVHGKRALRGVVAAAPPHLLSDKDRDHYPSSEQLVIDLGLPDAEVRQLVRIGDMVTPDAPMLSLLGQTVAGKAFDDRACVAAVTACLHHLQAMHHAWDVAAVATVQEESGLYGAQTAAQHLRPTIAIALDVTFAPQNGVPQDSARELNEGPVLALGANFHPALFKRLRQTAKQHEIKLQTEPLAAASGTDAWAIQVAREGVPCALLSIPVRNMHSAVETLDLRDVERAGRLLAHFISELEADWTPALAQDVNGDEKGEGA